MTESKSGTPEEQEMTDDTKRINALESLIEQASTKGVEIGQGCFCLINIGKTLIVEGGDLREALDELIDLQTEKANV